MFNLGFGELVVVALVALIFIQPQNIPKVATSIGRFLGELKRSFEEVKTNLEKGLKDKDS